MDQGYNIVVLVAWLVPQLPGKSGLIACDTYHSIGTANKHILEGGVRIQPLPEEGACY